ncbi:protein-L-isoaspartate O-methyltransferase [Chitinivibrio alkaliphilus ACht1]|uniref:Protein-L-isoaspartate O-methyltransferase n=2 Tax=Chitinivibrio TaxID=1505231 RepID=U7D853_9BACT|nr:protein-L-isoaspartate O-methyltransferase [Chitinivibrio alkaliphilus ACht1]
MDSFHFLPPDVARGRLVRKLRTKGITNEQVLHAIESVPRHAFVDPGLSHKAYEDITLPIDHNQTISQPFIVALMTQLLDVQPDMKVLEIGTGSGYQSAVLRYFTHRLFTVERIKELSFKARDAFTRCGIKNIICKYGDGTCGWPHYAPFDRIIVTAGAPAVPTRLLQQLTPEGILVIPTGDRENQRLEVYKKRPDRIERTTYTDVVFVPLIGEQGWKERE